MIQLLLAFLASGIFFMLIPGTLLGVWNLIQIGNLHKASAATTLWIQAHGHAQLFGWIGTFVLGIGFYSIPNLRKLCSQRFYEGWTCLLLWTLGVALRWYTLISNSNWHVFLPISAVLELIAVGYFFYLSLQGSRLSTAKKGLEAWSILLVSGSTAWLFLMLANLMLVLSCLDSSAIMPSEPGRKFLYAAVSAWVLPIVWGLSARWLPSLLGLKNPNATLLKTSTLLNILAVLLYSFSITVIPESLIVLSAVSFVIGLGVFEKNEKAPVKNLLKGFRFFLRLAYSWLLVSTLLFLASAIFPAAAGLAGAARHAVTVGFLSSMVFTIGPQVLPTFLGRTKIFCSKLWVVSLALLSLGCVLRVSSQILAYDFSLVFFWKLLPVSAIIELLAMTMFSLNMIATFLEKPAMDKLLSSRAQNDQLAAF